MLHLLHTNDIGRYILGWSADRKLTSTLFPILSIILNKRTYTQISVIVKRNKWKTRSELKLKNSWIRTYFSNVVGPLKCRFCKKLLLYEWNSGQLPISFLQIRFFCNQNIGETLFLHWVSVSPIFWLQENLIWMKETGNWSEVHT